MNIYEYMNINVLMCIQFHINIHNIPSSYLAWIRHRLKVDAGVRRLWITSPGKCAAATSMLHAEVDVSNRWPRNWTDANKYCSLLHMVLHVGIKTYECKLAYDKKQRQCSKSKTALASLCHSDSDLRDLSHLVLKA